jgi:hypothetical protein
MQASFLRGLARAEERGAVERMVGDASEDVKQIILETFFLDCRSRRSATYWASGPGTR